MIHTKPFAGAAPSDAGRSFRLDKLGDKPIADIEGEIRAFILVRNELTKLPFLLWYYRNLGVGRFFIVDDKSGDGSREFLSSQRDCHVFNPSNSYRDANSGVDWLNWLLDQYGSGYWSLVVEADELLVYPHSEQIGLPAFCKFLESEGCSSFFAFLLDMYPDENLSQATCIPGKPFYEICSYFDKDYVFKGVRESHCEAAVLPPVRVIGGPRLRKFYAWQTRTALLSRAAFAFIAKLAARLPFWHGDKPHYAPALIKVPLIKWHNGCKKLTSHLVAKPPQGHLSAVTGALLHFKFFADFHDQAKEKARRGQHYCGSQEYRRYLAYVGKNPNISFMYDGSRRYTGSETLLQEGLIKTSPMLEAYLA
jgi:Glycosyl transferase family 2